MPGAVLLIAGCTKASTPNATAPLVVAPIPHVVENTKLDIAFADQVPTWPAHAEDPAWVRTLPKAKDFVRAEAITGAARIGITSTRPDGACFTQTLRSFYRRLGDGRPPNDLPRPSSWSWCRSP